MESKEIRDRGEKTAFLIREEALGKFIEFVLTLIRAKAQDLTLIEEKELGEVLYRWRDWAGVDEVLAWLKEVIMNPISALAVLEHLMTKTIINGIREEFFLQGPSIENLISVEMLYDAVKNAPTKTPKQQMFVDMLAEAVKRKKVGKSYDEVRQAGSLM